MVYIFRLKKNSKRLESIKAAHRTKKISSTTREEDYQHPSILYICGENACDNSYVQQLFDWRHQQGYIVYTATESQVGGNNASTSEIKKSNLEMKNLFSKLGIFLLS